MTDLVLLRHGQSLWNLEDRFTGWVDIDLTPEGEAQAKRSGELIKAAGLEFARAFASVQTRAIRTGDIALAAADQLWIPMEKHWRLNERHYGGLTGLNKADTSAKHGAEQVLQWRRSYDVPPPPLAPGGPFDLSHDRRYAGVAVPATESLKTTLERVEPYWRERIVPCLATGESLLIAAHGNSLRAIVKILYDLSPGDIVSVEIPTGNPLVVGLGDGLKPVSSRYLDADRAQRLPG